MKSRQMLIFISVVILVLLTLPLSVGAHEPHECPDGFPDEPVLLGHLSQMDIVSGARSFEEIFMVGERLFTAVFNECDGQGRPATTGGGDKRIADEPAFIRTSAPDSNACAGCHNQPRAGGGGDFVANVFVLAQTLDPVTESVSPEFSNDRNTLGMFGAGAIEMLSREMTADLLAIRDSAIAEALAGGESVTKSLDSKGVNFGSITALVDGSVDSSNVEGVNSDLVIRPFHQAGAVISIREFTVNAKNHHHGMQAEERFDLNPAKGIDFDEDGVANELTIGDITAATIFQASLGTPGRLLPNDQGERQAVEEGEQLFAQVGCVSCHVPEMTLESRYFVEPNPLNPEGTFSDTGQSFIFDMTKQGQGPFLERGKQKSAIVQAYTDLKRHNLCDDPDDPSNPDPIRFYCNEQLAQGRPDQDGRPGTEFFLTRKLWDVGNSAPYGHRGDLTTISQAILYHGGEARDSRDAFVELQTLDQAKIVKFLKSLQVLPPGSPRVTIEKHDHGMDTLFALGPLGLGALITSGFIIRRAKRGRFNKWIKRGPFSQLVRSRLDL